MSTSHIYYVTIYLMRYSYVSYKGIPTPPKTALEGTVPSVFAKVYINEVWWLPMEYWRKMICYFFSFWWICFCLFLGECTLLGGGFK